MSDTTVQPAVRQRKRRWRKMFAAGLGLLVLAAAGYSLRPVGLVAAAEGESATVRFDVRLEPVRETTP